MFKMNFLKMRTASALKKNRTQRASIPYKKAATCGIIFSVEDKQKHKDVKEFIHKLEQDGKKVQVLEFLPAKKDNYEFMFDFFTIKDLSFWGEITSTEVEKFSNMAFDYLFYIDNDPNPLILNVLARSKAHCRIGRFNDAARAYFELMIEQNGTNRGLMDTMYTYTQQLR